MTDLKKKCSSCNGNYTKTKKGKKQCKSCINKQRVKWSHANRDKRNKHQKRWRSKHFFKHRASYLRPVDGPKLAGLWRQQRGKCALTGEKLSPNTAHLDHITPRCQGGSDELENLQWVTDTANKSKGALNQEEFLLLCKLVIANAEEV